MAATGYGNFIEIGPLDMNFQIRNDNFVNNFNVLFIDNPVGVGYSYFSNNSTKLVKTNKEIGIDLVNFLKKFLKKHSEFTHVPLYLFGESYGGKMVVEFAYRLAQKQRKFSFNILGIGLGSSYISPIDYVENYARLALHLGLVDKQGFTRIDELAKQIQVLINKKEFGKAADTENKMIEKLVNEMQILDVYNILVKTNNSHIPKFLEHEPYLTQIMNDKVKNNLNITRNTTWEFVNNDVYSSLRFDLMLSVTDKVEKLLNNTNLKIIVYNGILDFIVNTAGTISWLDKLNWKGSKEWRNQSKNPLVIDMVYEGYFKKITNLSLYAVLRAGHSVPVDNMKAMNEILKLEIGFN